MVALLSSTSKQESDFTQKEGYYFTYQMSYRLGNSEIWMLNFYSGFVEKEMWNNDEKIHICGFPDKQPSTFQLVKQENQYIIEENYIGKILSDQKTKLNNLITLLNESTKVYYHSKNRKTKLQIVYGSFKFKETESTVEEYEKDIYSSPHKRTRIDFPPKSNINTLELVDYKSIRFLSSQELEKLRVKKKPCT
ncbi:MAG: hypothetical protein AAGG68_19875 [Bacteroidota bacterium]